MCKISIDTVRRANNRTMIQMDKKQADNIGNTQEKGIGISVSFIGRTFSKKLSSSKIKDSFNKALNYVEEV